MSRCSSPVGGRGFLCDQLRALSSLRERHRKILSPQGICGFERLIKSFPARLANARQQRAVSLRVQQLPRDFLQLLPVVPVADEALHVSQCLQQAGIGVGRKLQDITQLFHLQPEGVDVLCAERRPFAKLADHFDRCGVDPFMRVGGQSI
jgi:hypothetical protein